MRQGHDEVGALVAQFWHILFRRFLYARHADLASEHFLIPFEDLRRHKAQHADIDLHGQLAAIGRRGGEIAGQQGVGLEDRLAAGHADDIAQHGREGGRAAGTRRLGHAGNAEIRVGDLAQVRQTIVELMVAHAARIVFQRVHGLVHGQGAGAGHRRGHGLQVGQQGALDDVAIVEQDVVRIFRARRLDQCGGALQAQAGVFGQRVIVVTEDVRVDIGSFQQGHANCRALGNGRCRV